MKINQIKVGVILSYVIIGLNILVNLIYTPILIRTLGQSEYGLYSLVSSIISYLSVLDLGFGNTIIIYTTKFRVNKKNSEENNLYGMFFIIYTIIGVIAGTIGYYLYLNINNIFSNTISENELEKAKILFKILILNLIISFPLSIFSSIITAYEKFLFAKLLNIVRIVFTPIIMIPLLILGYKSVALTIVIALLNIMCSFINMFYCFIKLHIKLLFNKFDFKLLKEIFYFSFYIFLNIIIDKINWNIDQFILGSIIGTVAISVYSIGSQINMLYLTFSTSISGVLLPKAIKMEENNASNEEFSNMFIKIGRIQYIILGLIITGFIIFGKAFIKVWAGENYINSYYISCILMLPMTVPLIQSVGINILQAKNMNKDRTIILFIISIVNILISIPLAKMYEGIGSAIGTSLSIVLGQIIILNVYYYKKIKINIIKFWKEIAKMTIPILISFFIGILYSYLFNINNITIFISGILIYIFIYSILMYFLGINFQEKNTLAKIYLKIAHKYFGKD